MEVLSEWNATAAQVEANAAELAQYAAVSQAAGLVPIVEPEILIEGGHDIGTAAAASARVISRCIAHLWRQVSSSAVRATSYRVLAFCAHCPDC